MNATVTRMTKIVGQLESLSERFADIHDRIAIAAAKANRSPNEVRLIAISKTHPAQMIKAAIELGQTEFGENRVQEAEPKISELGREAATWHLVGHLQANKSRRAVKLFDVIHSLDSAELARRLDRLCYEERRSELKVLIQVDLGHEPTKSGVYEDELAAVVAEIKQCPRLSLIGLMTLPPFFEEVEAVRPFFQKLRKIRDDLVARSAFADNVGQLSMGMTHDFEIAIEEGATMVRIGTALFGARS